MYISNYTGEQIDSAVGKVLDGTIGTAIPITYDELAGLAHGFSLIPEQKYIITDYTAMCLLPHYTTKETSPFDIIVTASSMSTFHRRASITSHGSLSGDTSVDDYVDYVIDYDFDGTDYIWSNPHVSSYKIIEDDTGSEFIFVPLNYEYYNNETYTDVYLCMSNGGVYFYHDIGVPEYICMNGYSSLIGPRTISTKQVKFRGTITYMKDLKRNISFRHDFININFKGKYNDGGGDYSDTEVVGLLEKNKNVSNVNVHDFCSVMVDYPTDDLHYTSDVVPFEGGTYNTFTYIVGNTIGYLKSCNIYYPRHDNNSFADWISPMYEISFNVGGKELTEGHN